MDVRKQLSKQEYSQATRAASPAPSALSQPDYAGADRCPDSASAPKGNRWPDEINGQISLQRLCIKRKQLSIQ